MRPIDFEGSNIVLGKPAEMTDEQCESVHAFRGGDYDGFPFFLEHWMPNKEDIDALIQGRGLWLKIISTHVPPIAIWTLDENNQPNI